MSVDKPSFNAESRAHVRARLEHRSKSQRGKVTIWFQCAGEAIPVASLRFVDEDGAISTYFFIGDEKGAHFSRHDRTGKTHIKASSERGSETLAEFKPGTEIEGLDMLIEALWPDPGTRLWLLTPPTNAAVTTVEDRGFVVHVERLLGEPVDARPMRRATLLKILRRRGRAGMMIFDAVAKQVIICMEAPGGLAGIRLGPPSDAWEGTATYREIVAPSFAAVAEVCRRRHMSLVGIRSRKIPPATLSRISALHAAAAERYRRDNASLVCALST